jgi:hypothetical protein
MSLAPPSPVRSPALTRIVPIDQASFISACNHIDSCINRTHQASGILKPCMLHAGCSTITKLAA